MLSNIWRTACAALASSDAPNGLAPVAGMFPYPSKTCGAMPANQATLLQQRRLVVLQLFRRNDYGSRHFVFGLKVEESNALRGTARSAHLLGVDADNLAELADHHQLRSVIDKLDCVHTSNARRDRHVLDAFSAAGLQAILLDICALAKAVLSHGENAIGALFVFF